MSPKKKFYLEESFTSSTQASEDWEVFPSWNETILVSAITESPVSRQSSLGSNVHSVTSSGSKRHLLKPVESPRTMRSNLQPPTSRAQRRVSESGSYDSHLKEKSLHSTASPIAESPSRRRRPSAVSTSQMSARIFDKMETSRHVPRSERGNDYVRQSSQPKRTSQRQIQENAESRSNQELLAAKGMKNVLTSTVADRKESRRSSSDKHSSNRTNQDVRSVKDTPRRKLEKPDSPRRTQKNMSKEATKTKPGARRASMAEGVTNGTEKCVSKGTSDQLSNSHRSVSPRRRRESMTCKLSLHRSSSRSKSRNKARPLDLSGHSSARNSKSSSRTSRRRVSTGFGTENQVCKLVVRQLPHQGSLRKGCIEILESSGHSVLSPKSVPQRRYSVF